MENLFIVNPRADLQCIKHGIDERISNMKALITCLMHTLEFLDKNSLNVNTIYHALWAIDGILNQLNFLCIRLDSTCS